MIKQYKSEDLNSTDTLNIEILGIINWNVNTLEKSITLLSVFQKSTVTTMN